MSAWSNLNHTCYIPCMFTYDEYDYNNAAINCFSTHHTVKQILTMSIGALDVRRLQSEIDAYKARVSVCQSANAS